MTKLLIYGILLITLCNSCAQFIPPTGGPKDLIPPKLVSVTPKNQTTNFSSKTIELTFNELIDATTLPQELISVPELKTPPIYKTKSNVLHIQLTSPLDSNTTYTLNFRNGIKDLTERNPSTNLKYVISTGNKIDSLQISGKTIDIQSKKPVLDVTVGLYKIQDTIPLIKRKPIYFTKTDSSGNYKFENLKRNNYFLIAFTDLNSNLRFDQKTESIGFFKDTLKLTENKKLPLLEIYHANHYENKIKKSLSKENTFTLTLDKNTIKTNVLTKVKDIVEITDNATITFYKLTETPLDTLATKIIVTDSLLHQDTLSTKIYFQPKSNKKKKLEELAILSSINHNSEQAKNLNYVFTFNSPIIRFDTSKVIFKTDTLETEKPELHFENFNKLRVTINTNAKENVELIFPSNTFENYKGDTNSTYFIKNKILQPDELGMIEGFTDIAKSESKIAQLIQAETLNIIDTQKFVDKFSFKNIIPNTYLIKIIVDKNQNGIWDPGNINTLELPETILITPDPIKIRANFIIKDINIKNYVEKSVEKP